MSDRVYRTANGKTLDIGSLILKNQDVTAVGNMKVNARGDKIKKPSQSNKSSRLLKNKDSSGPVMYERVVPVSPSIQKLIDEAEKNLLPVEDLPALPDVVISYEPQEITLADVDLSSIDLESQIDAIADNMVEALSQQELNELGSIEEVDLGNQKVETLTGLAAAIARAKERQ